MEGRGRGRSWKLEAGSWKEEEEGRSWKLEAGSWKEEDFTIDHTCPPKQRPGQWQAGTILPVILSE